MHAGRGRRHAARATPPAGRYTRHVNAAPDQDGPSSALALPRGARAPEPADQDTDWALALAGRGRLPGLHCGGVLQQIVTERAHDYADSPLQPGPARLPTGRFRAALGGPKLALIAEVKRASPSQGPIAALDPVQAALGYQAGGAAALSVLTEPRHFGGTKEALLEVAAASALPALRKDFVVHPAMLREAAEWGASAALLMVSVLGEQTATYLRLARGLGLDALVEVHDERELQLAMSAGADLIGVNNRDLSTLDIDLSNAPRLIARARASGYGGLLVAESGYRRADDLAGLRGLADAVLVGSSLAGSGDLTRAVRELMA